MLLAGPPVPVTRWLLGGYGGDGLQEVSWDAWFQTFHDRELRFIFQEHKTSGAESNFFRLDNPNRKDA